MDAKQLAEMLLDGRAVLRIITPKSVIVAFPQTIGESIAATVCAIQAVYTEQQAESKIAAAIDKAVADEREACAKVAIVAYLHSERPYPEPHLTDPPWRWVYNTDVAAAIRARK